MQKEVTTSLTTVTDAPQKSELPNEITCTGEFACPGWVMQEGRLPPSRTTMTTLKWLSTSLTLTMPKYPQVFKVIFFNELNGFGLKLFLSLTA
jgi:hypothetical protein